MRSKVKRVKTSMKVIIAGSRSITNYNLVSSIIDKAGFAITEVVSGCARGVDSLGERYAREHNISIKHFPAKWDTFGKSAGMIRNKEMAYYADALIAIYKDNSKGTLDMIERAKKVGLAVYEVEVFGKDRIINYFSSRKKLADRICF